MCVLMVGGRGRDGRAHMLGKGKIRKDLESQGKVREVENKWLWQAVFRKLINSVQERKGCTFSRDSLSPSPSSLWLLLKKRILSCKSNLQI